MIPHNTKKKSNVWKKNPNGVGQLPTATWKKCPKNCCVNLYVSGLAIKKNISVE